MHWAYFVLVWVIGTGLLTGLLMFISMLLMFIHAGLASRFE